MPPARRTSRGSRAGSPARALLAVLACTLALTLSACTDDGGDRGSEASSSRSAATPTETAPPRVRTRTDLGRVSGRLPRAQWRAVQQQVTRLVDRWWNAAYLGEDYPRRRFGRDAFPGFSRGAVAQARADGALMTNARLGSRIESVTARKRRLTLDVLATEGRARAVTARFRLVFRTDGDLRRTVETRGRLFLTRQDGRWQVFGYDVSRGEPRRDRPDRPHRKSERASDRQSARASDRKSGRKDDRKSDRRRRESR